jgi:predicted ester cyclase
MENTAQMEIVRRLFEEVWSKGNLDVIHETHAEEFVRRGFDLEGGPISGREGFKTLVTMYRTGYPDVRVPIEEIFEIGDRVITRCRAIGTNTGEAFGQNPTGRAINLAGQHIFRFADGRIAEEWVVYDTLALIQQSGLQLPAPQ